VSYISCPFEGVSSRTRSLGTIKGVFFLGHEGEIVHIHVWTRDLHAHALVECLGEIYGESLAAGKG